MNLSRRRNSLKHLVILSNLTSARIMINYKGSRGRRSPSSNRQTPRFWITSMILSSTQGVLTIASTEFKKHPGTRSRSILKYVSAQHPRRYTIYIYRYYRGNMDNRGRRVVHTPTYWVKPPPSNDALLSLNATAIADKYTQLDPVYYYNIIMRLQYEIQ